MSQPRIERRHFGGSASAAQIGTMRAREPGSSPSQFPGKAVGACLCIYAEPAPSFRPGISFGCSLVLASVWSAESWRISRSCLSMWAHPRRSEASAHPALRALRTARSHPGPEGLIAVGSLASLTWDESPSGAARALRASEGDLPLEPTRTSLTPRRSCPSCRSSSSRPLIRARPIGASPDRRAASRNLCLGEYQHAGVFGGAW
jgi:hypothetical protein